MIWIIASVLLAGLIIGFVAGGTNAPAAGYIGTAITAFIAGVLGVLYKSDSNSLMNLQNAGKLFVLYQACLFISYVGANILRRHRKLDCILGPRLKSNIKQH